MLTPGSSPWPVAARWATLPVALGIIFWRYAPVRSRVRKAQGMLCPWCLYDLRGRGGSDLCPECGQRVMDAEARRAWRDML